MDWPRMLLSNPMLVFIGIVVGIPVIVNGIIQITKLLLGHRERMAMIDRGMHPDLPTGQPQEDPVRAE